ncbi:unnamed protein product [Vitrella brassicaformis CCMP3155]|uniref:CCDC66 domain-containing protein n=3 Tax=Vitrella brassicaformis TaxID=1169539 RepID=A0A0G4EIC7_VITBC|nr:unnamed protein product [Vitrella brassicaformis CCMP3155]|eukprot:CEL95758.1 unnamed protein product [Vitrella brassicaformis CCMP3155]
MFGEEPSSVGKSRRDIVWEQKRQRYFESKGLNRPPGAAPPFFDGRGSVGAVGGGVDLGERRRSRDYLFEPLDAAPVPPPQQDPFRNPVRFSPSPQQPLSSPPLPPPSPSQAPLPSSLEFQPISPQQPPAGGHRTPPLMDVPAGQVGRDERYMTPPRLRRVDEGDQTAAQSLSPSPSVGVLPMGGDNDRQKKLSKQQEYARALQQQMEEQRKAREAEKQMRRASPPTTHLPPVAAARHSTPPPSNPLLGEASERPTARPLGSRHSPQLDQRPESHPPPLRMERRGRVTDEDMGDGIPPARAHSLGPPVYGAGDGVQNPYAPIPPMYGYGGAPPPPGPYYPPYPYYPPPFPPYYPPMPPQAAVSPPGAYGTPPAPVPTYPSPQRASEPSAAPQVPPSLYGNASFAMQPPPPAKKAKELHTTKEKKMIGPNGGGIVGAGDWGSGLFSGLGQETAESKRAKKHQEYMAELERQIKEKEARKREEQERAREEERREEEKIQRDIQMLQRRGSSERLKHMAQAESPSPQFGLPPRSSSPKPPSPFPDAPPPPVSKRDLHRPKKIIDIDGERQTAAVRDPSRWGGFASAPDATPVPAPSHDDDAPVGFGGGRNRRGRPSVDSPQPVEAPPVSSAKEERQEEQSQMETRRAPRAGSRQRHRDKSLPPDIRSQPRSPNGRALTKRTTHERFSAAPPSNNDVFRAASESLDIELRRLQSDFKRQHDEMKQHIQAIQEESRRAQESHMREIHKEFTSIKSQIDRNRQQTDLFSALARTPSQPAYTQPPSPPTMHPIQSQSVLPPPPFSAEGQARSVKDESGSGVHPSGIVMSDSLMSGSSMVLLPTESKLQYLSEKELRDRSFTNGGRSSVVSRDSFIRSSPLRLAGSHAIEAYTGGRAKYEPLVTDGADRLELTSEWGGDTATAHMKELYRRNMRKIEELRKLEQLLRQKQQVDLGTGEDKAPSLNNVINAKTQQEEQDDARPPPRKYTFDVPPTALILENRTRRKPSSAEANMRRERRLLPPRGRSSIKSAAAGLMHLEGCEPPAVSRPDHPFAASANFFMTSGLEECSLSGKAEFVPIEQLEGTYSFRFDESHELEESVPREPPTPMPLPEEGGDTG